MPGTNPERGRAIGFTALSRPGNALNMDTTPAHKSPKRQRPASATLEVIGGNHPERAIARTQAWVHQGDADEQRATYETLKKGINERRKGYRQPFL